MTDRPILFSGPMVKALLEGRKTMTRRILKPQPVEVNGQWWTRWRDQEIRLEDLVADRVGALRFAAGDRLWVRETWSINAMGGARGGGVPNFDLYELTYQADGATVDLEYEGPPETDPYVRYYDRQRGDWWPSIYMPRQFSRLTLSVSSVRVQRLQDISEEDAKAEGIAWSARSSGYSYDPNDGGPGYHSSDPRKSFACLWDHVNGEGAWDSNPWVAVVSFDVHQTNIANHPLREPVPTASQAYSQPSEGVA